MENKRKSRHRKRRLCEYCHEEYSHSANYTHKLECKGLSNIGHDHSQSESDSDFEIKSTSSLNTEYKSGTTASRDTAIIVINKICHNLIM